MGRHRAVTARAPAFVLQEALDASDVIGRWRYDVPNDRVYADTMVAHVLNLSPVAAKAGISLDTFLATVHPDDRDRITRQIRHNTAAGGRCVVEYRVRSSDGLTRWVLDRGQIEHDAAGRPARGHGVLIDMTRTRPVERCAEAEHHSSAHRSLERAAEHCLAFNRTIHEVHEPLLHRMSDMLLLELGMALAKIADRSVQEAQD